MRGRKPKPTALKLIEGNRGKRALNKTEPRPRPIAPACPAWLTKVAQIEWRRVAGELERMGLLTTIDRTALAGYCQSYARWRECEQIIEKGGVTVASVRLQFHGGGVYEVTTIRARPEVKLGQAYLAQVRQFCVEFGLTPSSRGRMSMPGEKGGAECPRCAMPVELCGCG